MYETSPCERCETAEGRVAECRRKLEFARDELKIVIDEENEELYPASDAMRARIRGIAESIDGIL